MIYVSFSESFLHLLNLAIARKILPSGKVVLLNDDMSFGELLNSENLEARIPFIKHMIDDIDLREIKKADLDLKAGLTNGSEFTFFIGKNAQEYCNFLFCIGYIETYNINVLKNIFVVDCSGIVTYTGELDIEDLPTKSVLMANDKIELCVKAWQNLKAQNALLRILDETIESVSNEHYDQDLLKALKEGHRSLDKALSQILMRHYGNCSYGFLRYRFNILAQKMFL